MRYARFANSPRQQRVPRILSDGQEYSTRDLVRLADVCAVNSIVSELRANGIDISIRRQKRVWFYPLGGKKCPTART